MIQRWDIITIGNLPSNRYWGEQEAEPYRPFICTCTLIQSDKFRLLVDPSLLEEAQMAAELFRRTGLHLADIDTVFITHAHGDHQQGLKHFPHAQWRAAAPVAAEINNFGLYAKLVKAAENPLFGEIDLIHTPGITQHHYSLRFDWAGYSVVIAGDAAVTSDYWNDRCGAIYATDFAAATQSMERLAMIADIIVPGHDNYFLVKK